MAQEAYVLSKQILPTPSQTSLLKRQSRKHLQKQMLRDELTFSMGTCKGGMAERHIMKLKEKQKANDL